MIHRPEILVVDDNHSERLFTVTVLQQAGYTVDISLNGQQSLTKIMTLRPQCLILSMFLPDMTGYAIDTLKRKANDGEIKRHPTDRNRLLFSSIQGLRNPKRSETIRVLEAVK